MSNETRCPAKLTGMIYLLVAVLAAILSIDSLVAQTAGPDRSKPPELAAPPTLKLPTIEHLKLSLEIEQEGAMPGQKTGIAVRFRERGIGVDTGIIGKSPGSDEPG